jgi:hypothetical protein
LCATEGEDDEIELNLTVHGVSKSQPTFNAAGNATSNHRPKNCCLSASAKPVFLSSATPMRDGRSKCNNENNDNELSHRHGLNSQKSFASELRVKSRKPAR